MYMYSRYNISIIIIFHAKKKRYSTVVQTITDEKKRRSKMREWRAKSGEEEKNVLVGVHADFDLAVTLGLRAAVDGARRTGFTTYFMFRRADFFRFTRLVFRAAATEVRCS